jgi:hypothetical protein
MDARDYAPFGTYVLSWRRLFGCFGEPARVPVSTSSAAARTQRTDRNPPRKTQWPLAVICPSAARVVMCSR